jgi:hypothetical protein
MKKIIEGDLFEDMQIWKFEDLKIWKYEDKSSHFHPSGLRPLLASTGSATPETATTA